MSITEAIKSFQNKNIKIAGHITNIMRHWLEHPKRHEFNGAIFRPEQSLVANFNMGRGFAVDCESVQEFTDWSKIDWILREMQFGWYHINDATKHPEYYMHWYFLRGFLCSIVQRPQHKLQVCMALSGPEGRS